MKTEVVEILDLTSESEAKLKKAADIIRGGGLVVFPTETVYGLGADGTNSTAAKKIYEAKGRPSDNPLIIHIASPEGEPEVSPKECSRTAELRDAIISKMWLFI